MLRRNIHTRNVMLTPKVLLLEYNMITFWCIIIYINELKQIFW